MRSGEMYFHGTKVNGIKELIPNYSLHGKEYVYLTTNKEVALIYTVNAIESFFESKKIEKPAKFQPWYSYGFDKNKIPVVEEYYPNATEETYANKTGYIYICDEPNNRINPTNIYCAIVTEENVKTKSEIIVKDVYAELLRQEESGKIKIKRYHQMDQIYLENIFEMIKQDIKKFNLLEKPSDNYTIFLREKFPFLFQ
jgi:hypothetical protein